MGFGGSLFGSRSLLNTEPQMNAAQKSDFNNLRPYLPAARQSNFLFGGLKAGGSLTDQQKLYQDERTYLGMSKQQHNDSTYQYLTTALANVAQQMKDSATQFRGDMTNLNAQASAQQQQSDAASANAKQNAAMAATRPQANSGGSTTTQPGGSSGGGPGGGTLLTGGNGINAQQYQLGKASLLGN